MDAGRLRSGERLAGLAGLALLVLTFLPWFREPTRYLPVGVPFDPDLSAWEAFAVVDVLIALTALAGLAVAFFAASRRAPAVPLATAVIAAGLAVITAVVVAYRLLNQPGPNDQIEVRPFAYLGLLAVLGVAAGAWRTMADERTDAEPAPLVPAQPVPDAAAAAGSVVATGGVPDAAPQGDRRPPTPPN